MSKLNQLPSSFNSLVKANGSVILSAFAGGGVIGTAYLASKATFKMARDEDADPYASKQDKVKKYWKLYIPAGISGATTLVCIVCANRVDTRKLIAAQSALTVTQKVYSDYREHVVEELGEVKEQKLRDKIAEKQVKENPPTASDKLLLVGPGNVLCCELHTGRYFGADMNLLKKFENEINAKILKHDYATLDDLYHMLGLSYTTESGHLGWTNEKLLELEFSTAMTDDGRPCLTFRYNYIKSV